MAVIIGCSSLPHLITGDGDAEIAKKARVPPVHFDKGFGLSLGGPCRFRFRCRQGEKWERFTLSAEARSLYLMDGEAPQSLGAQHSAGGAAPLFDYVPDHADQGRMTS
jgi:hypothetical protein